MRCISDVFLVSAVSADAMNRVPTLMPKRNKQRKYALLFRRLPGFPVPGGRDESRPYIDAKT